MLITEDALNRIAQHWAVKAVGEDNLNRANEIARIRLVRSAVGHQMKIDSEERDTDNELIKRVATAYELAVIEGLNSVLHPSGDDQGEQLRQQAIAGAFCSYNLNRSLPIPSDAEGKVFHILHLSALAYCGDQWTDLRRWLKDREQEIKSPSVADADWEKRLLYRLYDCWIRLFRKQGWDDLDAIREIIAGLRKDQEQYESIILSKTNGNGTQATALRLVALYHWAKATELLAVYMLQGQPVGIEPELDKHFESGQKAALAVQDAASEVILRLLHVASRRMVSG